MPAAGTPAQVSCGEADGPAGLERHGHPGGAGQLPGGEVEGELVLGEPAAGVADPPGLAEDGQVRPAVADQGRGQVGPVDVQLGQVPPGRVQVGGDVLGDAGLRRVGRGDAHGGDQPGVQVAQHVPLVPVEQHRAGLAAVPHLGVLDADPPVPGHSAAQRRRRAGQVHVLVADLPGGRHGRGRGLVAGLPGDERLDLIQQAQHLGQGLIPGGRVIPVRIQRRLQAGGGQLRHPRLRRHDRRSLRPAPAPAAPRSRPGPYAGRVPSS